MEIKDFCAAGGKVNLNLLPNGMISHNGKPYFYFSLIVGLNLADSNNDIHIDIGHDGLSLIKSLSDFVNDKVPSMIVNLPGAGKVAIGKLRKKILDNENISAWRALLSPDFHYGINTKITHGDVLRRKKNSHPSHGPRLLTHTSRAYHPLNHLIDSLQGHNGPVGRSMVLDKLQTSHNDNIVQLIRERESFYRKLDGQGRQHHKIITRNGNKDTKGNVDLLQVMHAIHTHPTLGRYYGLTYDFFLEDQNDQMFKVMTPAILPFTLTLQVSATDTDLVCYQPLAGADKTLLSTFSGAVQKIGANDRYYFGPAEYGLADNTKITAQFSTLSPDTQLQNENQSNQAHIDSAKNGGSFYDPSDHKQPTTQGIYMIQLADSPNKVIGINPTMALGQAVSVAIDRQSAPKQPVQYSLCLRHAFYSFKHSLRSADSIEEGWIHTNALLNGADGKDYSPQTIFHWTGQNLCITKPVGKHSDQGETQSATNTGAGVQGLFHNGENKLFEKHGYNYSFEPVEATNVNLVRNKAYSFLIRDVGSNGFVIPVHHDSDFPFNASLADLVGQGLITENYWYNFVETPNTTFILDDDPVNPPTAVFRHKPVASQETSTHMVLRGDIGTENERWLMPPVIDFQFASLLGMTSPEFLQPDDHHHFIKQCRDLLRRGNSKIPERQESNNIDYLADIRGRTIVVTAANWLTKQYYPDIVRSGSDFYSYPASGDPYSLLEAARLKAVSTQNDQLSCMVSGNTWSIRIAKGLEMSFLFSFTDEHNAAAKRITGASKALAEKFLGTGALESPGLQSQFPKATLQVSSLAEIPAYNIAIVLANNAAKIIRPADPHTLAMVFYTLSLDKVNYAAAVKQGQLNSTYTIMSDDGNSLPPKKVLDERRAAWLKENQNKVLLDGEYPAAIFDQSFNNVAEKEMFRNNFSVEFQLNPLKLPIAGLTLNAELWRLQLSSGSYINLAYSMINGNPGYALSYFYQGSGTPIGSCNLNAPQIVKVVYGFDTSLNLTISNGASTVTFPYAQLDLPFPDLNEKYLSLNEGLEQRLIWLEAADTANCYFRFVHQGDYFVYRGEVNAGYIQKSFKVQLISKFQDYYPEISLDNLSGFSEKAAAAIIPNNQLPKKPEFEMTPLLLNETWKDKNEGKKKSRRMQVMFEIERPFANEEKFALIIEQQQTTSQVNNCAIGRDLTTHGNDAPILPLTSFIDTSADYPYLEKYLINPQTDLVIQAADGGTYKILALDPYFDAEKNKWIAVIGFNDDVLVPKGSTLYNPFIKIVAAKYQAISTTKNGLSPLTPPKYMNLLTTRRFTCQKDHQKIRINTTSGKAEEHHMAVLNITIENINQVKASPSSVDTIFVVALRKENKHGFSGELEISDEIVNGAIDESKSKQFHVVDGSGKISIRKKECRLLCIYQFERFQNSVAPNDNLQWLDDPGFRLMYAEEFD